MLIEGHSVMNYQLIKVCGMRDAQNIREVAALGVNLTGLIFYPKSPRYVESISSDAGIIPDYSSLTPDPLPEGEGKEKVLFFAHIYRGGECAKKRHLLLSCIYTKIFPILRGFVYIS